jgi:putative transposase
MPSGIDTWFGPATVRRPVPNPLLPLRFLLLLFAGLVNREQAKVVEFLREENRVLREQLGNRRLRLTDDQRARLAVRAKELGRSALAAVATIVTPDTLLRWHRQLIAAKHTYQKNRVGRPELMKTLRELIVRMAKDNPGWGYSRIRGEMRKLGHEVGRTTIAKTLIDHGVPPIPERPTSWRTFLKSHANTIAAMDFFTAEVWTARGLVTHYVLFALRHASRMVEIVGVITNPDDAFMAQVARNLTDPVDGFFRSCKFVILDRDTKFTDQFRRILGDASVEVVTTAYMAPNMNAIAERFVQSAKRECLERLILFGSDHLQRALKEFVAHYHIDRPHQGLGNRLLTPAVEPTGRGEVVVDKRLGGLLRSYHRVA